MYLVALPFKDPETGRPIPPENIILETIKTTTLPIFSRFVPWVRDLEIPVRHLKPVDKKKHIYKLPETLVYTPVMWLVEVDFPFQNVHGYFGDIAPAYGINRSVQGVVTAQAYMNVAGQMRNEPTFDYVGDNKVRLYGFPLTTLKFSAACEHEPNGETIPEGCYDSFSSLAKLDMKVMLYNNLKLYKIPTAHGEADLKIDDFQSAEADREQLLEKWRDTFHVDMIDYIQWM